jgi:hypothetical protein
MPRHKLQSDESRKPAPMRMRPPYWQKLKGIAKAFGISPGEWTEQQVEPYMPKDGKPK